MLFTRLATIFAATALVSASNVKRQFASVESILDTLSIRVHQITPAIITIIAQDQESDTNISNECSQLEDALNQSAASLNALPASKKRQTADDVSVIEASIISDIFQALNGLNTVEVPSLTSYFADVDTALANQITAFHAKITDLTLVHKLLLEVGLNIINKRGFTKTAAALGGF